MNTKEYTREELLGVIASFARMIEHDNGQYPTVVLDDIRLASQYVCKVNNFSYEKHYNL